MITEDQARNLIGGDLYGSDGAKIGRIGQVFLDDETGQPEWVTVSTGMFGARESFVPLSDAQTSGEGATVPYDKDRVKGAPNVDVDAGHLSEQEEADLYSYYGLGYQPVAGTGMAGGVDRDRDNDGVYDDVQGRTVGRDTSGPTTDDAMTRSEERLRVGTEKAEAGRVRLRKFIVTENVQQTVPVTREQVRVEREPITEANRGSALSGPDLSEEEHEVVLTEERAVVEKETVPVERVRLDKESVTENVTVQEQVRKEQIETVGDTSTTRSSGGVGDADSTDVSGDADSTDASGNSRSMGDKLKDKLDGDR